VRNNTVQVQVGAESKHELLVNGSCIQMKDVDGQGFGNVLHLNMQSNLAIARKRL